MSCEHITDLAQQLAWLPTDGSDPTGVPAPLAAVLTPVKRYRHTAPSHAPVNRLEYEFLAALALSGWSMRVALAEAVNHDKDLDRRSGSFKLAWRQIEQAGLWRCVLVRAGQRRLALVRLTETGKALLAQIGVTTVASEWEQIEARHHGGGAGQIRHTGAICAFLYHARRNGYTTEPCPIIEEAGNAEPDAGIENVAQPVPLAGPGRYLRRHADPGRTPGARSADRRRPHRQPDQPYRPGRWLREGPVDAPLAQPAQSAGSVALTPRGGRSTKGTFANRISPHTVRIPHSRGSNRLRPASQCTAGEPGIRR